MVAEALGYELSEDYGKGYPEMGIKPGTPAAKKEAKKRKKKVVAEAYEVETDKEKQERIERAKEKISASPTGSKGPGFRDRMRIKAGKRAEAVGDVQASRIRARGEAGGSVGLKGYFGIGAGSKEYSAETRKQLKTRADALRKKKAAPVKAKVAPQVKQKPQLSTKQQQDIARGRQATDATKRAGEASAAQAALRQRLKDKRDREAGKFGAGTKDVKNPNIAGPKGRLTAGTAYQQIGSIIAEMLNLRD
jgi:hypothetical protein